MRTSKNYADNLDLRRIVGGLLVHWFCTLNALRDSGGFWCPLVMGNQNRRLLRALRLSCAFFQSRAWGPPGAGAHEVSLLP